MSSLLYGALLGERILTDPANRALVSAKNRTQEGAPTDMKKIGYWQDALAALVPAEVLAIHGVTVGIAQVAKSTVPAWAFIALVVLAFAFSFIGVLFKNPAVLIKRPATYVGALIAAAAFVLWTMLQPSSAFDSLGLGLSALTRVLIPVFGAVVLGLVAGIMAHFEQSRPAAA